MAITEAEIYARARAATLSELHNEVSKLNVTALAGDPVGLGKQEAVAEVLNMIEVRMDRYANAKR